jgi:hypothetical protein
MTISKVLHESATHHEGFDPSCPVCAMLDAPVAGSTRTVLYGFDADGIAQVITPKLLAEMVRDNRYEYGGRSNWAPDTVAVMAAAVVTVDGVDYAAETMAAAVAFMSILASRPRSIFSGQRVARKYTLTAL